MGPLAHVPLAVFLMGMRHRGHALHRHGSDAASRDVPLFPGSRGVIGCSCDRRFDRGSAADVPVAGGSGRDGLAEVLRRSADGRRNTAHALHRHGRGDFPCPCSTVGNMSHAVEISLLGTVVISLLHYDGSRLYHSDIASWRAASPARLQTKTPHGRRPEAARKNLAYTRGTLTPYAAFLGDRRLDLGNRSEYRRGG